MSVRRKAPKRDQNEALIVEALEAAGATVRRLSDTGLPDLLVGIDDQNYLMEVKAERGRLTNAQIVFMEEWGGSVAIVTTPEQALRLIGR